MAWEIENTVTTDNKAVQPQWEIEESKPLTQSVMDAETQQMYNVPLGMDATDAKFAIDTQHGGKNKDSFFGKVWTGTQIVGESIEEVFDDFNRAVVEHAGQLVDSLVLDKGLRYQKRMKLVEDWENGDWSYFGDKEFSDEEKQNIIRRQKEKIAYIQNLRERTQKFFNKGAQIMRPDEKLDNADKFFIAASSGIVSTAEAAAVALATKNPTVAAAAIGTTYAALKDTEYFDKAVAAGESANDASTDATVAGAIEGGLEFVGDRLLLGIGKVKPIQQLGNKVISSSIAKTLKSKVGRSAIGKIASRHPQSIFGAAVKGAVTEGGEEFMQEGAGMLWENYNDVSSYSMDEILSQSLFAFAAGSVSGAGMGGVGTSIYNQKITKDNTAIKNILKENTPELTDEELQVVADNVQEALLQQGAAYDEQITNLLRKESEVDVMPDGLTAESLTADTRAMLKEKYGMSDEDINKTIDIAANYIDARNGFNETYNEYFDKMDVAGYDRTVADNAARVLAARAVAIARAEGVSTEEVRKRWNLNLTRQSYEDFKNGVPVTDNYALRQRQIDDIMNVVPENWTPEQKKALRKGIAARARYGDLDKANFNAETAKQWFETKGAEESVKAINKRVQTIMGVLNFKEEVENVKKSKRINPQNVNPFEALVNDKLYNKIARIEKENKGDSLITFIVKRGGLKDVGGELKNMDAQKQRIGLINNKSGNSFDDIALAAWEHGYFPSHSERPTINDLLEAIDAELFGKKRYQYQEGNPFSMTEYVNSLAEQMDMLGVDYRGMTAEEAEAAYNKAAEEYSKNAKQYESEYTNTGENFDDFTLFQFAGENALTADMSSLEQAKAMDNVGYDPELIRGQTGWFKGADSKWRFEISDKDAKVNREVLENISSLDNLYAKREQLLSDIKAFEKERETNAEAYFDGYLDDLISKRYDEIEKIDYDISHGYVSDPETTLGELLQHDKLYAAYPSLKNMTVKLQTSKDLSNGGYSRKENTIYLDSRLLDENEIKSTLMHEIQHAIQDKENFSRGGNMQLASAYRKIIKAKEAKDFHKALDRKIAEAMVEQLKADNISDKDASIIAGAYAKYLNAIFDDSLDSDVVTKIEKEYYQLLDNLGIEPDRVENAYKAIQGRDLWQEALDETKSKLSEADTFEIYKAFAGEVEARNTQARMDMSDEERAATSPESTQDIKNADALVVFPDGTEAAYIPENVRVENGIVDLSEAFDKTPTIDEVKKYINKICEESKEFATISPDWIVKAPKGSYRKGHVIFSDKWREISNAEKERHNKYVLALSEILDNAVYLNSLPNKEPENPKKKNVTNYHYLGATVKIGAETYDVIFDTEQFKGDKINNPRKVSLYNVYEKEKSPFGKSTLASKNPIGNFNNNIPQNADNVKGNKTLLQSAFAGSRVDYDKPSLEAIGSGEGAQAHGWGLYYALNKDVADRYRDTFTKKQYSYEFSDKSGKLNADLSALLSEQIHGAVLYNVTESGNFSELRNDLKNTIEYLEKPDETSAPIIADGEKIIAAINANPKISVSNIAKLSETLKQPYRWKSVINAARKTAKSENRTVKASDVLKMVEQHIAPFVRENLANKELAKELKQIDIGSLTATRSKGQVHEVDIPESPYLIDEQKALSEQSDFVKAKLEQMNAEGAAKGFLDSLRTFKTDDNIDGRDIYQKIAKYMNEFILDDDGNVAEYNDPFKQASQLLAENGIKGITYDGRRDGRCFVIFDDKDVKVIQKFYQETAGNNVPPRGAFVERGDENIIFAFENADASTVIHELGHFFLHDMQKFADNPKTAEQLAEIYKYLGVENGTLTREQEEKFADTFEVYLLDGRAPNQILRGVFARFKKWISNLWYEVKRLSGINITDEVRATFDEMLGGKGLDFAMQASTLKMGQMLERGNISQWQTNRAMQMLYEGKMSKADMQNLIQQLRNGMKNKEFVAALKEFENKPANSNKEVLTEWDYTVLRNQLDGLNFNRDNVKARIEKLLKWSEPRTSGGKLVGRFPNKQLNDAFARYRELATMNKDEAKQKLQENVELIEDQMKSGGDVDIEQLIFENRLLSYNLNKISNSELLKLYDGLAESYNMGRLTDKITGDAKRERKKQMIERAKNVLTNYGAINPNIESSELKKRLARFGMSQQSWNGLLDTLSMNDERTQTGKSAISQDLEMFEAEQKKYAGIAADSELISQKLEKALSGTMNNAQSVTHYMNTELDKKIVIEWSGLIDPKERNPKYQKWQVFKRTFTKDQLIDIYMKSLDDDTREIMINDPVNQYNQAFLNKVKDELTTDDLAVADAIFEFYNENYERFNAFYEEHFGMSLPKSKYYTPRAMSVDGVTIDDKTTHGYASFSGAKKRVAVAGTGVINIQGAFRALNKYINQQNHYMGYMDKLTDINAVLANKDVKNIINSLFGAEMNKRIAYEINNLANNGNDKVDAWGKFWNKLRANYAKSVLAVKPSLAIKQLTSFPAYWENVGTKDFIAGVADFFAHPKEAIKTLGGTTLMKTRGTDIIRDFDQISKSDLFTKMKKAKGKIKWNDLLMFNIKFGDRGAIYMGGWALYKSELNKNLKAGMSEKEAKAKALEAFERITDETQQSGRLSQQSYMQSNSLWRAFTMFTSSQNQYLRKEINAIRGLATGRMSKAKAAKTIFIYHVLLPVFFQVVSDGFRWDKDNDLRAAVLGSLNGWFILNKVLENVYNWITDNGNMFKTRMSVRDLVPFWGSVEDLKNDLLKFADDEMELEDVLDVIKPIGEVTGLPLKYAKDVVENAGEYADEGEYGKELLLWLGWSPYSLRDSDDE